MSCARCHDHKFDPIPTTEYYALAGIFTSTDATARACETRWAEEASTITTPDDAREAGCPDERPAAARRTVVAKLPRSRTGCGTRPRGTRSAARRKELKKLRRMASPPSARSASSTKRLQAEYDALSDPACPRPFRCPWRPRFQGQIADTSRFDIRGEAEKRRPRPCRAASSPPSTVPGVPAKVNEKQSGRLRTGRVAGEFEKPAHAARRGEPCLARTSSAAESCPRPITSASPATRRRNPELLDHLATRFMRGWLVC